uniref:Si:dkeyp-75b4.8 n=1 Tax=Esox lucius TaxID=8010 RepID=A0AAY5KNX8_ESOLU
MDNPSYADQPPPYTEATFYPPIPVTASPANCSLHPNYSTPPPTYREAVVNGASFQQTNQRIPSTVVYIDPVSVGPLGDAPCMTRCSNCRQNITTIVTYKPGMAAWSMCLLFTLLGLICGCCLIPFLLRGFQDAHHTCPLCHAHLYIHIR